MHPSYLSGTGSTRTGTIDVRHTLGSFSLKDTRYAVVVAAAAAVLFAGRAEGQSRGRFTMPKAKPRLVVQKPAASHAPVSPRYPAYPVRPVYPVAFTLLPAVILSDGRIYADFGYGYEPVSRACAPVYSKTGTLGASGGGIRVVGANGMVLSGGNTQPAPRIGPAPRMAPHPNQPSDAQQVRPGTVASAAHSSCYRQEPTGTVVVVVR